MRGFINFWLFLFGVFSGAAALYSSSLRYLDIGANAMIAEIIDFYRATLYPVWNFFGSLFGFEISPLVADMASVISVFSLIVLRLIMMLLGVRWLLYILLPLPEGPPFPRKGLRKAFGLDFTTVDTDLNVRQFLGGPVWDYILVILGFTLLLPVTFFGLWRNRWLYNVHGVIAGTPFLAEPGMVAFNFRSMFVRQFIAIIAAILLFYIIG